MHLGELGQLCQEELLFFGFDGEKFVILPILIKILLNIVYYILPDRLILIKSVHNLEEDVQFLDRLSIFKLLIEFHHCIHEGIDQYRPCKNDNEEDN